MPHFYQLGRFMEPNPDPTTYEQMIEEIWASVSESIDKLYRFFTECFAIAENEVREPYRKALELQPSETSGLPFKKRHLIRPPPRAENRAKSTNTTCTFD